MIPVDILKAAKAKIADPANWCQGAAARDRDGHAVPYGAESARSWCALGSLYSVSEQGDASNSAYGFLRSVAARTVERPIDPVPKANDAGTHADVMAMFDKAIELAEKET